MFQKFLKFIKKQHHNMQSLEEDLSLRGRYQHGMILSGVGDALGYYNGSWEFCHSGTLIYEEMTKLGGLENIPVRLPKWMVSDDTVMHLATGEALISYSNQPDKEKLFGALALAYKESMQDMNGRAPGLTCMGSCHQLKPLRPYGYRIPFNPRGGGCGSAMRAMCIGLRYPRPEQLEDLIAVSVEAGRMTHHHPTGYLGSLAAALFTAYSVQGRPINSWGKGLLDTLPKAFDYIKSTGYCVEENKNSWSYFKEQWEKYLKLRNLESGDTAPTFPEKYGFKERDAFVKSVSFSGWGGSSGHDAPMIGYDALLGANGSWQELCYRAMFHAGDSDSTGVMAACWFGVMNGIGNVPVLNHKYVEYRARLEKVGQGLYDLAFPNGDEGQMAFSTERKRAKIQESELLQDQTKNGESETKTDQTKKDKPESVSDQAMKDEPESMPDRTKEDEPESVPDQTKKNEPESVPDQTKTDEPESVPDQTKKDEPQSVPVPDQTKNDEPGLSPEEVKIEIVETMPDKANTEGPDQNPSQ